MFRFVLQKVFTHVKQVVQSSPAFCNCSLLAAAGRGGGAAVSRPRIRLEERGLTSRAMPYLAMEQLGQRFSGSMAKSFESCSWLIGFGAPFQPFQASLRCSRTYHKIPVIVYQYDGTLGTAVVYCKRVRSCTLNEARVGQESLTDQH